MKSGTLLVITGPTGIGKTEVSVRLASYFGCAVVNSDSRQIYRELPIGTAAPTQEEQQGVKHYFVGTHSLWEEYNAGQFERDAVQLLERLMSEAKTQPFALLTGGSMMYIDAVCYGLDDIPSVPPDIRQQVQQAYATKGLAWLQQAVQKADNTYFSTMADNRNPQRLMHALEVTLAAGKPYSSFREHKVAERPWRLLKIGLTMPREQLYQRINERVDAMMAAGLEDEVRRAYALVPPDKTLPNSLRTVGYNELIRYLRGEWTRDEAVQMIKQNTRHYAKRQMTWFRRQQDILWLQRTESIDNMIMKIKECL